MMSSTHCNFLEHRCSITTLALMELLPWKPFHVYIANLTEPSKNLPKLIIVAYVSSAPIGIIYARDDEPLMLPDDRLIPMHCDKFNWDLIFNAVRYMSLKRFNDEVDRQSSVK